MKELPSEKRGQSPYSVLWSLEKRLWPHFSSSGKHKDVLIMQAYFDDSGTHDDSKFCLAAGYLADTKEWRQFDKRWNKALGPISDFHAKVFFKRDRSGKRLKPYDSLSDPDAFLDELLDIISTHDIHPLSSSIDVTAFKKLSLNQRRYLTGGEFNPRRGKHGTWIRSGKPSEPFLLPFLHVITETINEIKPLQVNPPKQVIFTFDQDKVRGPYMVDLYNYTKTSTNPENEEFKQYMGDHVLLANRIGTPGLQAADLLAHGWYQIGAGTAGEEIHRCMKVLTEKKDLIFRFTERLMQTLLDDMPESVRTSWKDSSRQKR